MPFSTRSLMFALLLLGQVTQAQTEYAAFILPDHLKQNAEAVIRKELVQLYINHKGAVEVEHTRVVTLLNQNGSDMAIWYAHENQFRKQHTLEAVLYDHLGHRLREAGKKEVQPIGNYRESGFSDYKGLKLDMTYHQYPYTVEFHAKYTLSDFFMLPDFNLQQLNVATESGRYEINTPADYRYQWKAIHTAVQPTLLEEKGRRIRAWTIENQPALPGEVYNDHFWGQYARILLAPEAVEMEGYHGAFSTWKEAGAFLYQLNAGRDALSPIMQAEVRKMIASAQNNREKIAILYRYLQQNHRYVSIQIGIGGWQTFPASFVEEKKYGDCKALSNYMKALLKVAGIEAQLAVTYAGPGGAPPMYPDIPVPEANHMLLYVPSENMWLECTSRYDPAGYLGSFTSNRDALLLDPEGGRVVRTPALTANDNCQINRAIFVLAENGRATIQLESDMHGVLQEMLRQQALNTSDEAARRTFLKNSGLNVAQMQDFRVAADPDRPMATLNCAATIDVYAHRSGKRLFVPLHTFNTFECPLPEDTDRRLDLVRQSTYTSQDSLVFIFPEGYTAENIPADVRLNTPYGSYEQHIDQLENGIVVQRRIRIEQVQAPAAEYQNLRRFYLDCAKADAAQMVLLKK
jgi:uncharacterized lipoprotein YehR (DUF1307 family)